MLWYAKGITQGNESIVKRLYPTLFLNINLDKMQDDETIIRDEFSRLFRPFDHNLTAEPDPPVTQRLGNVHAADAVAAVEIGQRASDTQNAMITPRG